MVISRIAEAKAACHTSNPIAVRFGSSKLESDSLSLVKRIQNLVSYLFEFDIVLDDLISLSGVFELYLWTHVKRDGNTGVHNLTT